MIRYTAILTFWILMAHFCSAQITGANEVRKGNFDYKMESYEDAEAHYRRSLEKGIGSVEGKFNLGNALYRQKKYKESIEIFKDIAENQEDKSLKAKSYHNLGNSYMQMEDYQNSVNAYKNALRNNPLDDETRNNLLMAMSKLEEQKNQQKNEDKKDDKQDQEKEKDKKEEQQDKKENEQKDQDKKQDDKENKDNKEEKKDQDQQQQQEQQPQMSKEEAQRILDALNNDEKEIQDKLKKKKVLGNPKKIEKDW